MKKPGRPQTCRIKGCGYPAVYRKHQLCATHYQRFRLGQAIDTPIHRHRTIAPFTEG